MGFICAFALQSALSLPDTKLLSTAGIRLGWETQRLMYSSEAVQLQVLTLTQGCKLVSARVFPRDTLVSPSVEPPKAQWLLSSSFFLENVMSHKASCFRMQCVWICVLCGWSGLHVPFTHSISPLHLPQIAACRLRHAPCPDAKVWAECGENSLLLRWGLSWGDLSSRGWNHLEVSARTGLDGLSTNGIQ